MCFEVRAEREATLTSGFSFHTQSQTDNPRSHQLIHEKEKKRLYLQSIRDVEHSSFSPLLLVEWRKKLRSFTNAWPLSSLKSMGKLIVPQWPG